VKVEDIAAGLSRECRYNGQLKSTVPHYSVAQHATLISRWLQEDGWSPKLCYAGLHHDSAEAYTGDIIAQVKHIVPELKALEARVEAAVFDALSVSMGGEQKRVVKQYDFIALATELRDVLAPNTTPYSWGDLPAPRDRRRIIPWSSSVARMLFLERHSELVELMEKEADCYV
jgi:hypothetical protein